MKNIGGTGDTDTIWQQAGRAIEHGFVDEVTNYQMWYVDRVGVVKMITDAGGVTSTWTTSKLASELRSSSTALPADQSCNGPQETLQ